jgi:hypothetical protein
MKKKAWERWSSLLGARGKETLGGRGGSGREKLYNCQLHRPIGNPGNCQRLLPGIVRLPMNLIMGTRSAAAEARRTLVANILQEG